MNELILPSATPLTLEETSTESPSLEELEAELARKQKELEYRERELRAIKAMGAALGRLKTLLGETANDSTIKGSLCDLVSQAAVISPELWPAFLQQFAKGKRSQETFDEYLDSWQNNDGTRWQLITEYDASDREAAQRLINQLFELVGQLLKPIVHDIKKENIQSQQVSDTLGVDFKDALKIVLHRVLLDAVL